MSVIERLKQHILVDGFHVVIDPEKSNGSWIVDSENDRGYLDCYSQFASQALGWNHRSFLAKDRKRLQMVANCKLANSDMYSDVYCDFVDTFASIAPDFKHFFFIEGGAMGVENALKAAFDWKTQIHPHCQEGDGNGMQVIHLADAFHGRSGYTLSLTNTGEIKTKWFPKFTWPRVPNPPKIHFPVIQEETQRLEEAEHNSLGWIEHYLMLGGVAAIIMETIQGEGGDNHFRPEFFQGIRKLADKYQAMFILDEVQCGMGLTGKWWAYEHMGVVPDMICFGKKSQVCGFCSTERIDEAPNNVFKQSGRINSTWGGNIVDMERARLIIEIMKEEDLVGNAAEVGLYFLDRLIEIPEITNVRGRGLMLAFDLPSTVRRNNVIDKLQDDGLLALKSGCRSIRFRPALTFTKNDVDIAILLLKKALS
jgi:L-lysine 6-transaminase